MASRHRRDRGGGRQAVTALTYCFCYAYDHGRCRDLVGVRPRVRVGHASLLPMCRNQANARCHRHNRERARPAHCALLRTWCSPTPHSTYEYPCFLPSHTCLLTRTSAPSRARSSPPHARRSSAHESHVLLNRKATGECAWPAGFRHLLRQACWPLACARAFLFSFVWPKRGLDLQSHNLRKGCVS